MKVKALRGVCVGPEDNLEPGQERELDENTASYLVNLGAAEQVVEQAVSAAVPVEAPAESAPAA